MRKSEIVPVDHLDRQLAQAQTAEELRELIAKADAVRGYMRSHLEPTEEELRRLDAFLLRAQRRLGAVLEEVVHHEGGRPPGKRCPEGTVSLRALGLSKKQSSQWQRLAAMEEEDFEAYLERARAPTLKGALRHAMEAEAKATPAQTAMCNANDLRVIAERGYRFRTVYADPPWPYENRGTRGTTADHYSSMTLDDLCALPVPQLLAEDAQLHLWTTNGFLRESFAVMDAWGFTYKSCLIWSKRQLGLGNYWRVSHEFLLVGIRGNGRFQDAPERHKGSVIEASREQHSAKPEVFRKRVEAVSYEPRIELFGRWARDGWVVWGNEVKRDLLHQSVEEIAA